MRRSFYAVACIAALVVVVLALPVWAQGRGGGQGGSHGGFSSHSSGSAHVGSAHVFSGHAFSGRGSEGHASAGYGSFRGVNPSRGVRIRTGNRSYDHRGFHGRRGYYPYGAYYPSYGYNGWYADALYDSDDQDSYADEYRPAPYREDDGLQRDEQALNGKANRVQADVEARNRPTPTSEPETALVFRDQHVVEVRNYAISGGMVWVLNENVAKKIPLDQLDLDATVKMNGERGVDFQVPGPTLSIMIVN